MVFTSGIDLNWVNHSQGNLEYLQAASQAGVSLSGNNVWFHNSPDYQPSTARLSQELGFNIMGYRNNPNDLVSEILGMNGSFGSMAGSLLHAPQVFSGNPGTSPHTMPFFYPGEARVSQFPVK